MKRVTSRNFIILAIILSIGWFLRFYHLGERGLILFDEALYLLETRWILGILSDIPWIQDWIEWAIGDVMDADYILSVKPGFDLLLAGFSLIVGLKDYTGLFFSGLSSLIIILLIYVMGKRYFGKREALFSTAFLSIMPYFLYYSRSGLAEMGFLLFFYSGIFLYIESLRQKYLLNWRLFLAGLSLGYSFTCSYKWFLTIPIFIGIEGWLYLKREGRISVKARRFFAFLFSLLLPTLLIEAAYVNLKLFRIIPPWIPTYFGQFFTLKGFTVPSGFLKTEDIFIFGYYFLRLIGPIALLFLGAGLVSFFKERSREGIILSLVLLSTIFLFGILSSLRVPRAFSGALPAIALIMGKGVVSLSGLPLKEKVWQPFIFTLLPLHFLYSGIVDLDIVKFKSGYKEALSYLVAQNGLRHITTSNISVVYAGCHAFYYYSRFSPYPNQALEELKMLYKNGFRFFLVDWMDKYWVSCFNIKLPTLPQLLQHKHRPVKIFPNDVQRHWLFLYENGLKTKEVKRFSQDERVGQILIYDLDKVFVE